MPEFTGQHGRWDRQDRALGMSQAVPAHPGKDQPRQRTAAARTHDQHIITAARKTHQDPACRSSLYPRLHQPIIGNLTPHRDQRVPQPLAGEIPAYLAQRARVLDPLVAITARRSQASTGIKTASWARAKLSPAQVGLGLNECRRLGLDDVKRDLGRFGKLHVRYGKGSRGTGPKQRLAPMINGARAIVQWYVEHVRGYFDDEWDRPGAPLLPSERKSADGSCKQVSSQSLRDGLAGAVERHLPPWSDRLTPHVPRHYCASQL